MAVVVRMVSSIGSGIAMVVHMMPEIFCLFFVLLLYAARDAGEEVLRWPVVQVTI